MKKWQNAAVIVIAAACTTVTGVAVAAPNNAHPHTAPGGRVAPAAIDASTESRFVPITPCRIVDTRRDVDGPLVGGGSRSFYARGAGGITSQGGARGGCGIPNAATAIDVSFQATNSTSNGYVNETAQNASFATASLLHLVKGQTVGTGSTFPLSGATDSSYAFKLEVSSGKTDVLVDVLGYYIKPMWAQIAADGSDLAGSRVTASQYAGTGSYVVTFDRDVTGCAITGTPYASDDITLTVYAAYAKPDGVYVRLSQNGAATDQPFYLTVTC